jgi:hypothetical protein
MSVSSSGINIILFSKTTNKTFVSCEIFRAIFDIPIVAINDEIQNLIGLDHWRVEKTVANYAYLIGIDHLFPTLLIQTPFLDEPFSELDGLFPYLYEPTPFEETYIDTPFYKDLYIHNKNYINGTYEIDSTNAKIIFAEQNFMLSICQPM